LTDNELTLRERIIKLENEIEDLKMSEDTKTASELSGTQTSEAVVPEAPVLTSNKTINQQLITIFWVMLFLTFLSQILGFVVMGLTGNLPWLMVLVLSIQAVNTIIIGGALKMMQRLTENLYKEATTKT
jgi:hypothetical protein